MTRRASLCLLVLSGTVSAFAAPPRRLEYTYSLSGAPVGSGTATVREDGSFEAKSSLSIGRKIDLAFSGRRTAKDYADFDLSIAAGKTFDAKFAGGKLTIMGKDVKPVEGYGSNFLPFANWNLDTKIDAAEAAGKKTIDVLLFEPLAPTTYQIGNARVVKLPNGPVRIRTVKYANLNVELAFDSDHECVGVNVPVQGFRIVAKGFEAEFRDPFAESPELSQATFKTRTETGWVPMADGTRLRTDLVMPVTAEKVPAILVRTPYGRANEALALSWYAARGYAVVAQDVRGRGESEGEWDPFVFERADGRDAVDWIAKQPWSSGNVGMIGGSYVGFVQWAAAAEHPAALKCIVPQVSPPMSAMRNLPYLYGAPMLTSALWWLRIVENKDADMSQMTAGFKNPDGLKVLPLSKLDDAFFGHDMPLWDKWLSRDRASAWTGWNFESDLAKVDIPSLSISGYFDGDEIGTMLNWQTRAEAGKRDQWLVYGPWSHLFNSTTTFGGVDFGDASVLELDPVYLRFFDTYLKGKDVGWEKTPRVQAFVTGANVWTKGDAWPLPEGRDETIPLLADHRLGDAGTAVGKEESIRITFDPAKVRVPDAFKKSSLSLDGNLTVHAKDLRDGVFFRTSPMAASKTISGPIELDLGFSTSARSTDFFATLLDEAPDGTLRLLGLPGAVRASYQNGDDPTDLVPGRRYRAKVRIWDFTHRFARNDRLVLVLSSNAFPAYARNLGTNEPIATATKMVVQRNVVYLGGAEGSVLRYRVLP